MAVKPAYSRTRVITKVEDTSTKAVQSERHASDINNIVGRAYATGGALPYLMNRQPIPELPDVGTYQDMLNKVVYARQAFDRLPVAVRNEFGNNPEAMLAAVSRYKEDPALHKRLAELGLVNPSEAPVEPPVEPPKE